MLILHGLWFDIVSCYALVRCSAAKRVGALRATSAVCLLRWLVPTGWAMLCGLLLPPLFVVAAVLVCHLPAFPFPLLAILLCCAALGA
jgi:hypothetical protein